MIKLNKLIIGTANFGMSYGVANKKKISKSQIKSILYSAAENKIWGIDTASGYKDAEVVVGEYLNGLPLHIITKLPNKRYLSSEDVIEEVKSSLDRLQVSHINILLVHNFANYQKDKKWIMEGVNKLIKKRIIKRWGISVYNTYEAEKLLEDGFSNFVVEFPLNLFDRRFLARGYLEKLKQKSCFLIGRSVFLQGLLMLQPNDLQGNLITVKDRIKKLIQLSRVHKIPVSAIALLFVLTQRSIDKVIIGVDSEKQLSQNIAFVEYIEKYINIIKELDSLEVNDESIILPYKWELKA